MPKIPRPFIKINTNTHKSMDHPAKWYDNTTLSYWPLARCDDGVDYYYYSLTTMTTTTRHHLIAKLSLSHWIYALTVSEVTAATATTTSITLTEYLSSPTLTVCVCVCGAHIRWLEKVLQQANILSFTFDYMSRLFWGYLHTWTWNLLLSCVRSLHWPPHGIVARLIKFN